RLRSTEARDLPLSEEPAREDHPPGSGQDAHPPGGQPAPRHHLRRAPPRRRPRVGVTTGIDDEDRGQRQAAGWALLAGESFRTGSLARMAVHQLGGATAATRPRVKMRENRVKTQYLSSL